MAECHSIEPVVDVVDETFSRAQVAQGMTWTPVIYFNDGRVLKIEGRWPHDKAVAIAEQGAYHLDGVESFGAQRAK